VDVQEILRPGTGRERDLATDVSAVTGASKPRQMHEALWFS
jgi:hypothetical protein